MKALTAIRNGAGDDDPIFEMGKSAIAHRMKSAAGAGVTPFVVQVKSAEKAKLLAHEQNLYSQASR